MPGRDNVGWLESLNNSMALMDANDWEYTYWRYATVERTGDVTGWVLSMIFHDFVRRSGTTRAGVRPMGHGGVAHRTCGELNEPELTAADGLFYL